MCLDTSSVTVPEVIGVFRSFNFILPHPGDPTGSDQFVPRDPQPLGGFLCSFRSSSNTQEAEGFAQCIPAKPSLRLWWACLTDLPSTAPPKWHSGPLPASFSPWVLLPQPRHGAGTSKREAEPVCHLPFLHYQRLETHLGPRGKSLRTLEDSSVSWGWWCCYCQIIHESSDGGLPHSRSG